MPLIDVNDLESNSAITADICIVGSGAAGITLATALDGLRIAFASSKAGAMALMRQPNRSMTLKSLVTRCVRILCPGRDILAGAATCGLAGA